MDDMQQVVGRGDSVSNLYQYCKYKNQVQCFQKIKHFVLRQQAIFDENGDDDLGDFDIIQHEVEGESSPSPALQPQPSHSLHPQLSKYGKCGESNGPFKVRLNAQ